MPILTRSLKPFQSTHSLRSATGAGRRMVRTYDVSIHALLAECDRCGGRTFPGLLCFNPRTPCGVRQWEAGIIEHGKLFQSTHSLRSATNRQRANLLRFQGFNPRTPCGVRPGEHLARAGRPCFNPRTPCGVRRTRQPSREVCTCFNPRTPCGVRLRPTLYIATQQSKSYFAPTSLKRPSLHGCSF